MQSTYVLVMMLKSCTHKAGGLASPAAERNASLTKQLDLDGFEVLGELPAIKQEGCHRNPGPSKVITVQSSEVVIDLTQPDSDE